MASMEVQLGPASGPTNRVDSSADPRYHDPYDLHHSHNLRHRHLDRHYYGQAASPQTSRTRKRKAESQDNERLSKRLSLLNLEKNGQKLYVPVEAPSLSTVTENHGSDDLTQSSLSSSPSSGAITVDDGMQLDDTKHKVYIYDLDAELSSADENSENESSLPGSPTSGRSRLIFLPDIEKHLARSRIPPSVLANSEGELAGHNIKDMQMVLYSEPSSLTVPPEHDSVRKAILEARARARQRHSEDQAQARREPPQQLDMTVPTIHSPATSQQNFGFPNGVDMTMDAQNASPWRDSVDDVDAMDMD
ncbi:hypothetical protein F5Y01DRAFT_270607 [Xylaria sp. FL0043]|nr:hypothetical protein F5Y01DRAFT_270607 [Xylaria sp. FL0043]